MSKINNSPCVHEEWRIIGAGNILKKSGIATISDLVSFNFKTFFENTREKHLIHEEIDHEKHGKWRLNWSRRKKLTEDENRQVSMESRLFCLDHKIETAADLVRVYGELKVELKSRRGPKRVWEKRLLTAKPKNFITHL